MGVNALIAMETFDLMLIYTQGCKTYTCVQTPFFSNSVYIIRIIIMVVMREPHVIILLPFDS